MSWQVKSALRMTAALLLSALALPGDAKTAEDFSSTEVDNRFSYQRRWGKSSLEQRENRGEPRVALALSGGGARGFAHIGVLRAFEESGITIAGIAGTSMGAVVGGLYAVGYSPAEIEDIGAETDLSSLFANAPRRRSLFLTQREKIDQALITLRFSSLKPVIPTEFTTGQRLSEILSKFTMRQNYQVANDFTRLQTPFLVSATDMETGQAVTLQRGNLAQSIRASMAFPLALSAVELDGRLLADGGMTRPAPVDLARSLLNGEGYVVAVNTTKELMKREKISDIFEVASQVTTIMSRRELFEQLAAADFVITPAVRSFAGANFRVLDKISRLGYESAAEVIDSILQNHDQRRANRSLKITSVILGGERELIEALAEPLITNSEAVSAAFLDSLFDARWRKGDLLTLSARTIQDGSGHDMKLIVEAVGMPKTEQLTLHVTVDNGQAPDSVFQSLTRRIRDMGKLDIDSLAAWAPGPYRSSGADLSAVKICRYDYASGVVTVDIDEGRVWHLQISGLKRTRPSFVRDRVHFSPGQAYSMRDAQDTYRDLYGSGVFKRVTVDVSSSDSGAIVHVAVKEQNSLLLKLGYRWDDEYHNEGFAEALENNMFGIGVVAFARGRFAERRKRYSFGMKTDRLFRTYVAFDLQAYAAKHDRQLFLPNGNERGIRDEDRIGGSFRLTQQIARFGAGSAGIRIESVETFSRADSAREDYELRALRLTSVVEDLDRTYFPTDGRRNRFTFESAGKVFGGATEYNKWYFSLESYFPLSSRLNVRPRFVGATSSAGLPAAERFYLGGLDSFEGLRAEELSGAKALLVNLQIRYQVYSHTYLIARYNTGNTFEQTEDVSLENVRSGWAALLGFDTIGGPIIFGYGRANGNRDRFYFTAGLRF